MGAVYRARQKALDRTVALKLLPAGNRNGIDFATRFNREARALARLNHPNIVAVHEFGEAGGLHYFIMEFVDGANLRQLEKAGRLSAREALQIVPQICDALQYAHDEGVVHRDIKPENVMVDRKGRVKVTDFGLAKIMGVESSRLTVEGQIMGTPHYMAPEQIERPLAVDHRADIYSLGVVLYEMLTGELPLGRFAPPSHKAGVDIRLDEVVHRALENDPERRYQRAGEVKTNVETIITGPAAAPQTTATTPVSQGRKHLYWAGLPVATEQDGEREINWSGTGVAIGIALLLETLGLGIVRLTMGVAKPRDPAIQICVVAAIIAVLWSVQRRMDGPPKQPAAAPGESFVQRLRRWWRHGWLVLAAIPLAVVLWCWVQITWLEPARAKARGAVASRPLVAFGPVLELELGNLLDFDTGKTGDFPANGAADNPFAGMAENVAWMERNGYDAEARPGELGTLGMTLVAVDESAWNSMAAAMLPALFPGPGEKAPVFLRATSDTKPPLTAAFRTREGATGLLQVLAFTEDRSRVTLRYKLIKEPPHVP